MTFNLNFQDQIWNLLYLSKKWSNCYETKNKHINWTLGLKCNHQVWPWVWLWRSIFKVKHGICYISDKNGPIAMKRKANISFESKALNAAIGLDLGHDLDLQFSSSRPLTTCMALTIDFQGQIKNSCISRMGRPKGMWVSHSWPWPWMTFWWPRWDVRIYCIVTGVAADVDLPTY